MSKRLKGSNSSPIARIVDLKGKPGTARNKTKPEEVDKVLLDIWGNIAKGNVGPHSEGCLAKSFMWAQGEHFVKQDVHVVPTLHGATILQGIDAMPHNSPGLDGALAVDLKLMSHRAAHWLAQMFGCIESGAPWPKKARAGRIAWLDKNDGLTASLNLLDYRGLAILPKIYRLCFAIGLADADPWVEGWQTDDLFAGAASPVGAEDAWYLTSIAFEKARLQGDPITGGSTDIWMCFDQIQRADLLYFLLEESGFPKEVLTAYSAFHEHVIYDNTIGKGLGAPHFKPCGIPRGCPLSMTLVGFLFHPCARKMRAIDVIPRGLADDLTIYTIGGWHEIRVKNGYKETLDYLELIGA